MQQQIEAPDEGTGGGRWSGLLRSVVLPLGVLAVILGGLWYWEGGGGGGVQDDPRFGIVELPAAKNATGRSPSAEIGRAGPDFLLETADGGELRLSDLQGSPVIVNFWASWCRPCRDEMPILVRTFDERVDAGLVVVGVNLQEPNSTVRDFADEFGIKFPLVIDRDGELKDVWRLGGPFSGIPTTYLLDDTGVIRASFLGPFTEETLTEKLETILPAGSS